ncbi:hypothetical protein ACFXJ8_23245 [Nonomuraea sp. NPDC059194]|uniref:hypothetical protein n=1 Tax=Nonomuraea sp. NPDC059194 TaxID=3346764 RepID=UPI0036887318
MTTAVQAYSYAGPSTLAHGRLGLSTSGGRALAGPQTHPRFFSGLLTQAAPAAAALLAVADVAMAARRKGASEFARTARDLHHLLEGAA